MIVTTLQRFIKLSVSFVITTNSAKFQFVFVPEMHRDGAWHLHGLINDLPLDHLRPFTLEEKLPTYIRDKLQQGQQLYEWPAFAEKFGYTVVEPLRDQDLSLIHI